MLVSYLLRLKVCMLKFLDGLGLAGTKVEGRTGILLQ